MYKKDQMKIGGVAFVMFCGGNVFEKFVKNLIIDNIFRKIR